MPMTPANADGIELCYEELGDPDGTPLLLVMGLGAQLQVWEDDLIAPFGDAGFRVIRFDNRDVGLSTKVDVGDFDAGQELAASFGEGRAPHPPYFLSDMATDSVGLLDHLGIDSAHVVGASMGGMIAQTLAIEAPERVRSLTSIMSTTGDSDVGQPHPETLSVLLEPEPSEREAAIEAGIATIRTIGCAEHYDEDRARRRATTSYDRCHYPAGTAHQLLAILASGSRSEALARSSTPTLVIHGAQDRLVDPSGGRRTAEVIPGAELLMIDDMAHDVPEPVAPRVVEAITGLARRADAMARTPAR